MARKSKIETEKTPGGKGPEPAAQGIGASAEAKPNAIIAPRPKRKKTVPKNKTVRAVKPATARKSSPPTSIPEPSDEEIRIRAYFIAERRIQLSLQGDSDHDWIEAKRQLVEEAKRAAS